MDARLLLPALITLLAATGSSAKQPSQYLLYVGAFTRAQGKGIYAFRLNTSTGKLTSLGVAAATTNPSFLAIHPNGHFLYSAVNKADGEVSAYAIDQRTAMLTLSNRVSSKGDGPCFLALTTSANMLLVANYISGSAAVLPVKDDGRLGEATGFAQHYGSSADSVRQSAPHTHSVNPSPDQRFAIAVDLGVDKLYVYHLEHGRLIPNDPPIVKAVPGAGPRHFTFHLSGEYAYLVNELNSTVTAFKYDQQLGQLEEIQVISAVPRGYSGTNSSADVHVHPSGKFLYASDRGFDSIAVYSIDPASGKLSPIEYVSTSGKTPRNFAIDPTGSILIAGNEDSDSIVVFRINPKTGRLAPTGERAFVPTPACIKFVPQR